MAERLPYPRFPDEPEVHYLRRCAETALYEQVDLRAQLATMTAEANRLLDENGAMSAQLAAALDEVETQRLMVREAVRAQNAALTRAETAERNQVTPAMLAEFEGGREQRDQLRAQLQTAERERDEAREYAAAAAKGGNSATVV